ncbi:MAG: glycoside hydrolase family 2 TIM barrel-domain containing protein [Eubacteriales bacterium]
MNNIQDILNDPTQFKINRLDAHSDHIFYDTLENATCNNKTLYYNLNGMWKFHYSNNLQSRPVDFYKEGFDSSHFDEIPVPSHIQMNGYDKLHYVNTMYPWDGMAELRPPVVDTKYNPVGSYIRHFDLPSSFLEKTVCISLEGVEQAFSLYLNGTFIGYSEDTFTPSHFDLSEHIRDKNNVLAIEVYKKSSSAWIEDQDFFRFSGIFRDVILYAKPLIHIEDLFLVQEVSDNCQDASLQIKVKSTHMKSPNVSAIIVDPFKKKVYENSLTFTLLDIDVVEASENKDSYFVTNSIPITSVSLWDIGQPNLYELTLIVYDDTNRIVEVIKQSLGFRKFEMINQVMFLNGKRLIINGVNRHEWHARKGRAITIEDMMEDIKVLQRNNISAVRTSHYPNQSAWYKLCDEAGIIVMDEANLESHGSWQKLGACEPSWNVPGSLLEWRNNVVDRAVSMFERDKNHPSILWWSCGNESYAGECILAMANYFRRKDTTRIVHYEGCTWNREFEQITDVESRMYAYPNEIEEYFAGDWKKPFLLCEYMHNMGNSLGGMESYINLLDKYEGYQGGFIWDYMDQALYKVVDGQEVLCYGGDFTDRPSDYNFSGNGIVFANRVEKPAMQEVKYWYSTKEERLTHNRNNEQAITSADYKLSIQDNNNFQIIHGDCNLGIKGDNFHYLFSYDKGGPLSLVVNGYEWLYTTVKPTYFRATTENDMATNFTNNSAFWLGATKFSKHCNITLAEDKKNQVSITYTYDILGQTTSQVTYTTFSDGTIKVRCTLNGNENLLDLPLFGMRFITMDPIQQYEYIGYSGETYPDRYKGGTFGTHTAHTEQGNYLVPQENSNHYDTYRVTLSSKGNSTLSFVAKETPFSFSLLANTAEELENATHVEELPNTNRSVLSILGKMRGVGGINTWGAEVEKAYHILAKEPITFEFSIHIH